MPYVKESARILMREEPELVQEPGELSFLLSQHIKQYLDNKGGPSYGAYNDVMGVLAGLQMEFYRRLVGPYEDTKLDLHGDVF